MVLLKAIFSALCVMVILAGLIFLMNYGVEHPSVGIGLAIFGFFGILTAVFYDNYSFQSNTKKKDYPNEN